MTFALVCIFMKSNKMSTLHHVSRTNCISCKVGKTPHLQIRMCTRLSHTKRLKKIVLDASFLNTQQYNVWIKNKWSNPEKGVVPSSYTSVVAIEKGAFGSPTNTVANIII